MMKAIAGTNKIPNNVVTVGKEGIMKKIAGKSNQTRVNLGHPSRVTTAKSRDTHNQSAGQK